MEESLVQDHFLNFMNKLDPETLLTFRAGMLGEKGARRVYFMDLARDMLDRIKRGEENHEDIVARAMVDIADMVIIGYLYREYLALVNEDADAN